MTGDDGEERKRLGERLREARSAAGLSQAEAARIMGLSRCVWWGYEGGRAVPSLLHLRRAAYLFDVTVEWLVMTLDAMGPPSFPPAKPRRLKPGERVQTIVVAVEAYEREPMRFKLMADDVTRVRVVRRDRTVVEELGGGALPAR
jgi:transcriptional regulator with XRE-family HTH domain